LPALPWSSVGEPDRRLVGLVRGAHVLGVDRGENRVSVDPRDLGEHVAQLLVVVEQQRAGEVRQLQGAVGVPLGAGVAKTRGDDRATAASGPGQARLGLTGERHPVAAERELALRLAQRRVAARGVLIGMLGEADEHELPIDLIAVAPLQDAQRRAGRVRPGAGGIAEQRGGEHRWSPLSGR
jgi:hypothetical protein